MTTDDDRRTRCIKLYQDVACRIGTNFWALRHDEFNPAKAHSIRRQMLADLSEVESVVKLMLTVLDPLELRFLFMTTDGLWRQAAGTPAEPVMVFVMVYGTYISHSIRQMLHIPSQLKQVPKFYVYAVSDVMDVSEQHWLCKDEHALELSRRLMNQYKAFPDGEIKDLLIRCTSIAL